MLILLHPHTATPSAKLYIQFFTTSTITKGTQDMISSLWQLKNFTAIGHIFQIHLTIQPVQQELESSASIQVVPRDTPSQVTDPHAVTIIRC